mgnify:CR=1 FL=1
MIKNILCKKNGGIMDFREINTFIHVANQESFSKAADVLGYTQAAVSIQIKQLESELGTRLFDRIGKHISLTHQGKAFYQYALRITRSKRCTLRISGSEWHTQDRNDRVDLFFYSAGYPVQISCTSPCG